MTLHFIDCWMSLQITPIYVSSDALFGPIHALTTLTNSNSDLLVAHSLGIVIYTKATNALTFLPAVYTYPGMLYLMSKSSLLQVSALPLAPNALMRFCSLLLQLPPGYNQNYRWLMILILTLAFNLLVCCLLLFNSHR
jgi:hypothetical protein